MKELFLSYSHRASTTKAMKKPICIVGVASESRVVTKRRENDHVDGTTGT